MDAVTLLTADHNRVRGMFTRFKAAKEAEDTEAMGMLCRSIFTELDVHTRIEEEIFYPAVKKEADEEIAETVDEGIEEHHVVDVLMEEIRQLDVGSDEFVAKMTVLIENVEHHADEEEEDMFPDAREQLGEERLTSLGDELAARKAAVKAEQATRDELYEKAKERDVPGRSDMTKEELAEAVGED